MGVGAARTLCANPSACANPGERRVDARRSSALDHASTAAVIEGEIVAACLIGADLGAPFVYEVAVRPDAQRSGLGAVVLARSVTVLGRARASGVWAWITDGNLASERLFTAAGFRPSAPMTRDEALAWYHSGPDPLVLG